VSPVSDLHAAMDGASVAIEPTFHTVLVKVDAVIDGVLVKTSEGECRLIPQRGNKYQLNWSSGDAQLTTQDQDQTLVCNFSKATIISPISRFCLECFAKSKNKNLTLEGKIHASDSSRLADAIAIVHNRLLAKAWVFDESRLLAIVQKAGIAFKSTSHETTFIDTLSGIPSLDFASAVGVSALQDIFALKVNVSLETKSRLRAFRFLSDPIPKTAVKQTFIRAPELGLGLGLGLPLSSLSVSSLKIQTFAENIDLRNIIKGRKTFVLVKSTLTTLVSVLVLDTINYKFTLYENTKSGAFGSGSYSASYDITNVETAMYAFRAVAFGRAENETTEDWYATVAKCLHYFKLTEHKPLTWAGDTSHQLAIVRMGDRVSIYKNNSTEHTVTQTRTTSTDSFFEQVNDPRFKLKFEVTKTDREIRAAGHGLKSPDFFTVVGIVTLLGNDVRARVDAKERELLQKWGYLVEEPAAPSGGGRGRRRRVVPYFGVPGDADDSDASRASRASRASDDAAQPFARRHPAF
jgi:hypothetical protein